MLGDKKTLLIVSVAVLGIAIGSAVGFFFLPKWQIEKPYSAVYLINGGIYVGQLSSFPKMVLDNPYILEVTSDPKDSAKVNSRLVPLSTSLWAPSKLYLNPQQVIFYGEVGKDSSINQTLKGIKQ